MILPEQQARIARPGIPEHWSACCMRIVIVVAATGAGGAERVIALLANAWIDRGWDVSIVCFEPPGTVPYYAMPSKVRLVQDPDAKRSKSGLATALAMLRRVGFIRRALISERPRTRWP